MAAARPTDKLLRAARLDAAPSHLQPSRRALLLATLVSLAGSLVANYLLVRLATSLYPATRGFSHYRPADYASLTVLGALAAAAAWPAVTRISWAPRWLFFRLAVAVTVLLFLPDLWLLLLLHEPLREVGFLMAMHLAMALVVYNALVHLAPIRAPEAAEPAGAQTARGAAGASESERHPAPAGPTAFSRLAPYVGLAVGLDFLLGVAALFVVRVGRPSGFMPPSGKALYLAHALVGLPLAAGALALVPLSRGGKRADRVVAWLGLVGVGLAGAGGLLTASHPLRLLGMGLMVVGPMVAGAGYLIPALDRLPREVPEGYGEAAVGRTAEPVAPLEPIEYNRNWPARQAWPGDPPG